MQPKLVRIPMRAGNALKCQKGKKTATSRPYPMGAVGDFFQVNDGYYEITTVTKKRLGEVAALYFDKEGFGTTEEFIAEWRQIHPNKGYQPDWIIYYHTFKRKY